MRYAPDLTDDSEREEVERLNVPEWMLGLLQRNPDHVSWGPGEDYMRSGGDGWESSVEIASWTEFDWVLDDLNECVNFYFKVDADSKTCPNCGHANSGSGYHPDAIWISDSFFAHTNPFVEGKYPSEETLEKYGTGFRQFCETMREAGYKGWGDMPLSEDDKKALKDEGRNADGGRFGHDAINSHIIIRARCKRWGLPFWCPECEGRGHLITSESFLSLVLWMIHPRKGASRGVLVRHIEKEDVPEVLEYLREAAQRNQQRFQGILKGGSKNV